MAPPGEVGETTNSRKAELLPLMGLAYPTDVDIYIIDYYKKILVPKIIFIYYK
jgi:hypothetical protein